MGFSGVEDTKFRQNHLLRVKDRLLDLSAPKIMGVLNVTPDSFYATSRVASEKSILKRAEQFISEGADILDIGGCSTRPGAELISPEEEINRISPAIEAINRAFPDVLISVDTFRSSVAEAAIQSGAELINDISGWQFDEKIVEVAKRHKVPYILMHCADRFENMHQTVLDDDHFFRDIIVYFSKKLNRLAEMGIVDVVIDPGLGFSKTMLQNYALLDFLPEIKLLNKPVLVGVSRMSMIYKRLGVTAEEALNGTTILNTKAILNGASILRVHDVKEAKEIIALLH
jgi:dihydropteroate synthase